MELMDIVSQRRSVRKYLPLTVEREKLKRCVEAARHAPSADNLQPWRFIILDDPETRTQFCRRVTGGIFRRTRFIEKAPVIVVLVAKINFLIHRAGKLVSKTDLHLLDMGIAGEHFVLQAQELGIGTCWINLFDVGRARRFLGLPRKYRVVSLIAAGYPAEGGTRNRPRLALEQILRFNDECRKIADSN
jgi:nitroreductase